jgi:hypothetical protein
MSNRTRLRFVSPGKTPSARISSRYSNPTAHSSCTKCARTNLQLAEPLPAYQICSNNSPASLPYMSHMATAKSCSQSDAILSCDRKSCLAVQSFEEQREMSRSSLLINSPAQAHSAGRVATGTLSRVEICDGLNSYQAPQLRSQLRF